MRESMGQRVLVILGHPLPDSFCGALADQYVETARDVGCEVKLLRLSDLKFDPILWPGYNGEQPLEPDLIKAQSEILWAQHLVFVYPNWWGTMPALQKGFIDRVFLPGFAFKYRKNSVFWDKLLTGRSAHVIVTMDSPPWYYRWVRGMPGHRQMRKTILEFSGVQPVRVTSFGPIRGSTEEKRAQWLEQVQRLASAGAMPARPWIARLSR